MPIPFSRIPQLFQMGIIQKQDIRDFANFSESSRECYEISKVCNTTFTLDINISTTLARTETYSFSLYYDDYSNQETYHQKFNLGANVPARVLIKHVSVPNMHKQANKWLTEYFLSTNFEIRTLHVQHIYCKPEQLNALLKAAKVTHVSLSSYVSPTFLSIPAIQQLNSLLLPYNNLADEDFLRLKVPTLTVGKVSIGAINTFLKEWIKGDRSVNKINVWIANGASIDDVLKGLDYEKECFTIFEARYCIRDKKKNFISILHLVNGSLIIESRKYIF